MSPKINIVKQEAYSVFGCFACVGRWAIVVVFDAIGMLFFCGLWWHVGVPGNWYSCQTFSRINRLDGVYSNTLFEDGPGLCRRMARRCLPVIPWSALRLPASLSDPGNNSRDMSPQRWTTHLQHEQLRDKVSWHHTRRTKHCKKRSG